MHCLRAVFLGVCAAVLLGACTTGNEPEEILPVSRAGDAGNVTSSSSGGAVSSSSEEDGDVERDSSIYNLLRWVEFRGGKAKINSVEFTYGAYSVSTTEVTQAAYAQAMGGMPNQPKDAPENPVVNVSWFEAVLFCNELSKSMGLDTAYVYSAVGDKNYLQDIQIDYSVESFRLATEIEWEVAAHGGTNTMFYWGTDKASDYVYYGQTSGPTRVGSYPPNPYGLYDMAGNVAEWVNDWYGAFPTKDSENYTGAASGTARVVRGGGWSDPIKDCAPDVREKKDPLYTAPTLGFRVVRSLGTL